MKKIILAVALFFLTIVGLEAQDFKFALLTDIHINKNPFASEDVERSVKEINDNPEIKFVIVSGDLTEEGDRNSLNVAKSLLDKLKVKYYAIPGNHETKWSESGVTSFGHIFGSDRFKFEYNGYLFLGFNTGPVIRMMDGHVSPQDITWLKSELDAAKPNQPVIIVTHYPLLDGDVDNWYEVTDLIRNYNVKVVLGGHYHKNQLAFYDGIPGIINRSNLRGNEPYGGFSIYDITQDSIVVSEKRIGEAPRKWGGYSLTEKYYTTDVSKYKRPDYSVNEEYSFVKDVWQTRNAGAIYSSPVVYDNKVYVADDLGYLSCYFLESGQKLWQFKTENRILGTPAVSENIVVVGSTDNYIYGIDAVNGTLIWKYKANDAVIGAVTIGNHGKAYVGASDHNFYCLNIKDGSLVWAYPNVKGYVETRPLLYAGKVIFGAWDNNMYALDADTGELKWAWDGGLTRMHFSPAAVWPVAAHGKLFFTAPDRVMTALDVETGKTLWRTNESMVRETIGLSEDSTRVYSKTMQDSVVCYSAVSEKLQKIWKTNVGYGYDHAPSMPVEKDGVVFGCTKNGIIFALDAVTGKLLWKHKVGNSLISTVVPLSGKECVYTSAEGYIGILHSDK
ncbi:MAG: PQQ-binding-like beta-propeller repeat protein [Dysgonomonas sp.]